MKTARACEMIDLPTRREMPDYTQPDRVRELPRHDFLLAWTALPAPVATVAPENRHRPALERRRKFRTGDLP